MAKKKEPPVLEGEILEEKGQKKKTGKPSGTRPRGPVTERGLVLIAVLILVVAGGYFGYPWISDWLRNIDGEGPVEAVVDQAEAPATPMDRLASAEAKIAALEAALESQSDTETPSPDLTGFEDRLSTLEQKVDALSLTQGAGGEIDSEAAARIQALENEIAVLREALAQGGAFSTRPTTDFAQAVAQLAPPLYQSRSFEGELEQLRILILALPTLEQATLSGPVGVLSDYAGTGIPALDDIRTSFNMAALEALKTEGLTENAGWWDKTWARIKGLVVVRRTDETDTTTLAGAIRQAELHLEAGNLTDAIGTIDTLPENTQKAFVNWRALSQEREAAIEALDTLMRSVPRGLSELS